MLLFLKFLLILVSFKFNFAYKRGQQVTPPDPIHNGYYVSEQTAKDISELIQLK